MWRSAGRLEGTLQGSGVYARNPVGFGESIRWPMGRDQKWLVICGTRKGGSGRTIMLPLSRFLVATSRPGVPGSGKMHLRGLVWLNLLSSRRPVPWLLHRQILCICVSPTLGVYSGWLSARLAMTGGGFSSRCHLASVQVQVVMLCNSLPGSSRWGFGRWTRDFQCPLWLRWGRWKLMACFLGKWFPVGLYRGWTLHTGLCLCACFVRLGLDVSIASNLILFRVEIRGFWHVAGRCLWVWTEPWVEGSGATGVSSFFPSGALQVAIAGGIWAGLMACLAFACSLWLDEIPCLSRRRDYSGRLGMCRCLCGSCCRSRRWSCRGWLGRVGPQLSVLVSLGGQY